ncbi:MAG: hypothetical protein GTO45_16320 [Candidatus Aminicenantes bacterium]|nr:hypothetical protein [Candidatus Aminicenantes bacterium]NIM78267.1 hypothetical protein [Candidatus Aminicenantes bacterium]NIN19692.1 hypothetical protein [Candidatus Aminicenantes bacterium]NIN43574.1 hypothetical protein [Candidatus Aminicenantes bacterium]NIN86319.1 hypothetical protein [Candidatus Aminicenantes bacterium]
MLHFIFAGSHIILQIKGKVNRLAKETNKQKSNKYQESGGFIKKRRAREMKKKFWVTLEYEAEINENVRVPDSEEIRPENLEKIQQIIDALQSHQDYLNDYYKIKMSIAIRNGHVYFDQFGQFIQEKNEEEIWSSLAQHLQTETASYLLCLTGNANYDKNEANEIERERSFFIDQIGPLIGVNAWFKEIGVDIKNNEPWENEGIMAGVLVIGQLLPNGEIVPLQGLRLQPCGFIQEK